jgi:hypothetical protein
MIDTGPDGPPTVFAHDNGRLNASFGPVDAGAPPHWRPYFSVESTEDAMRRVRELDGKELLGPTPHPTGASRLPKIRRAPFSPSMPGRSIHEGEPRCPGCRVPGALGRRQDAHRRSAQHVRCRLSRFATARGYLKALLLESHGFKGLLDIVEHAQSGDPSTPRLSNAVSR